MRLTARDSMSVGLIVGSLVFGFLLATIYQLGFLKLRRRMQLPEWEAIVSSAESRERAEQGALLPDDTPPR